MIVLLSIAVGCLEFYLNSIGRFETKQTQLVWGFVFVVLTIVWTLDDVKKRKFEKPFDFGFLMYVFWPIAFPYYLVSTRGIEGLVHIAGFLALWLGPWMAGLVAYVYVYE